MTPQPLVSVVVETSLVKPGEEASLAVLSRALSEQTWPNLEVITAAVEPEGPMVAALREHLHGLRVARSEVSGYFAMKRDGSALAEGEIVAFLDSDCIPEPQWAEAFAETIQGGADLAAGRTRYGAGPFSRTLSYFQFGVVFGARAGELNFANANNSAIRRELLRETHYDPNLRRGGADYQLARRLRARGHTLAYAPRARVVHAYEGDEALRNRIRAGFDAANLVRLDGERALPESRLARFGPLAPLALWLSRVLDDWRRMLANRRQLGIRVWELPWFLGVSFVLRSVEAVGWLIARLRPGYLEGRYGW